MLKLRHTKLRQAVIPALALCGMLVSTSTPAQQQDTTMREVMTIVIDAGHGGEDSGTVGVAGVLEKDLTLQVALALRDELERRDPDLRVVMTRDDDSYPTLDERTHLANMEDADLFVSLHFNAAANTDAHGIETYFLAPDGTTPGDLVPGREDDGPSVVCQDYGVMGDVHNVVIDDLVRDGAVRQAATLAELVQSSLLGHTDANDREVRQARFRVLRGARMPAVVIELGFLTNPEEGMRVLDADYQAGLVTGLADALNAYDAHRAFLAMEMNHARNRVATAD